jgi:hypothetical protein
LVRFPSSAYVPLENVKVFEEAEYLESKVRMLLFNQFIHLQSRWLSLS